MAPGRGAALAGVVAPGSLLEGVVVAGCVGGRKLPPVADLANGPPMAGFGVASGKPRFCPIGGMLPTVGKADDSATPVGRTGWTTLCLTETGADGGAAVLEDRCAKFKPVRQLRHAVTQNDSPWLFDSMEIRLSVTERTRWPAEASLRMSTPCLDAEIWLTREPSATDSSRTAHLVRFWAARELIVWQRGFSARAVSGRHCTLSQIPRIKGWTNLMLFSTLSLTAL